MKLATKLKVEKEKQLEQHQREVKQKLNALVKCAFNRVLTAIEVDCESVLANSDLIDAIFSIDDDATIIVDAHIAGQFRDALLTFSTLRANEAEVSDHDTQSD